MTLKQRVFFSSFKHSPAPISVQIFRNYCPDGIAPAVTDRGAGGALKSQVGVLPHPEHYR